MHLAFWVNLVPILLSLVPGELEVKSWSILIVSLVSCQIFLCAIFFLYLWVQDGHLFEQIYWPFLWELIGTVSNLHLDTGLLQFFQLTKGNCFVITQWTKAWAINRLKGFMLACGSQPWVQKCTQPRNQSYIGMSIGFVLTYQSKIRKVWGYCYLCTLARGSNLLLPPWFASKA